MEKVLLAGMTSRALRCLLVTVIFNFQFSIFNTVSAQTFVDELRREVPGQGKVTVEQSKEIEELVNGKQTPATTTTPSPTAPTAPANATTAQTHATPAPATPTTPNGQETHEDQKPDSARRTPTPITSETEGETAPPDTRKKIMRRSYKMQGYRVQVFSGGNSRADRQKAETAGAVMKSNFPDQPIYTHFYSPSWKCRMGNYRTQAEAQAYLAKVRKLGYRQACIVKGPIQVAY